MKNRSDSPDEFIYTKRARRQDAAGAMRGDIILGLIEAITNADDAYAAQPGKILIKVSAKGPDGDWTVSVSDRACGIPAADVMKKLISTGERTSGYEHGERKRGNRGRGAKDLAIFGGVKFESICGRDAIVVKADRNGQILENTRQKSSEAFKKDIGVTKSGTRVTILCRKNIARKQFDSLKRQLQNAVALRRIMENPDRTVILSYPDREETVRFVAPKAVKTVYDGAIEVNSYHEAKLKLYVASEPFNEDSDVYRLGGIVITSGPACHESTLFGSENHPYANRLFGWLEFDAVDELTRELDDLEERDEDPPDSNPFPIISRIRNGLEKTHPAYRALRAAVRPIVDEYLKSAADSAGASAHETSETQRRSELTAREVVKWTIEQEQEIDTLLAEPGIRRPAFEIIPTTRVLEHGQRASFTVRARADVTNGKAATVEIDVDQDPADAIADLPRSVELPAVSLDDDFSQASLRVEAGFGTGSALIAAKLLLDGKTSGHTAEVIVSVVEPVELPKASPPGDFEFASREYSVATGRERRLLLLAPANIVQEIGTDVILSCSDQKAVKLREYRIELERVAEGWFEADVTIEGIQHGGDAQITATTPNKRLHASAHVVVRDARGPRLEIRIEDIPGAHRAVWEETKDLIVVRVNATHPAARRYFGPAPDFQFQNRLPARMMVAEAVADVALQQALNKEAERLPAGALDIDALQAKRSRKLQELLPRLHRAQVSDADWDRDSKLHESAPEQVTA